MLVGLVACARAPERRAPFVLSLPAEYPPRADAEAKCEAGDAVSCAWVASMYRFGLGMPSTADHVERSLAYASRACDLGLPEGCTDVGVVLLEGGRDVARAETSFRESCTRRQASACVQLALLQTDHLMPEEDAANAFPLVEAACRAPSRPPAYAWKKYTESPCEIAGRMLEVGRGVAQDVKRARATFAMGCRGLPSSAACCDLARGPDGEECERGAYGCRGTKDHSSSCIDGVCRADLAIGEACKAAKQACTRGSFCDLAAPEPRCAAKRPSGGECRAPSECEQGYCERGRCAHPPVHVN